MGAIGHMSLNLPDYSGNMAFKDQVLVLNWINQNIDKFGGNPNNVTLFGHGSGDFSVLFLIFCVVLLKKTNSNLISTITM